MAPKCTSPMRCVAQKVWRQGKDEDAEARQKCSDEDIQDIEGKTCKLRETNIKVRKLKNVKMRKRGWVEGRGGDPKTQNPNQPP